MAFRNSTRSAADIAHCDGYSWSLKEKLGSGSYGEVYKGWKNNNPKVETAVKVVQKHLFKQDPKAEQNLRREIDILFKLAHCEYVVKLFHVEDMKRANAIVLVMELCECDLDKLLKRHPFTDKDITLLLYQLGEGMKALRAHNIVHRDIKPGNILIKYHPKTGKMMIKLADFGFARHFTDENMKPLDLTSLAGTPVFMAPEALRCVFNPGAEHYDDKVDLWSIGALVYKVLIGQCGFYAQLNHILKLLEAKGDAIAWEPSTAPNYGPTPKVNYIKGLPDEVDDRLSPPYKQKMNTLLVSLLKIDPLERMTFPEFFDFVDDLMKSKVEVVNLLHGSSFKFMMETEMSVEQLLADIQTATGIPAEDQIIFSAQSDIFINGSNYSAITDNDFNMFMNRAGGSQGHAIIYFVPVKEVMAQLLEPDYGPVAKLYYCVENRASCVELILGHKYSDEIVHSISYLQKQIERQFSCIQEFRSFATKQLQLLHGSMGDTRQDAYQTLAKAKLACEWLTNDVSVLDKGTTIDSTVVAKYRNRVADVSAKKQEIQDLIAKMDSLLTDCEEPLLQSPSLDINDLINNVQSLTKQAKSLATTRRDFIYQMCEELLRLCKGVIVSASERAHRIIKQLYSALQKVWDVRAMMGSIINKKDYLEQLLSQSVPQWRSELLGSLIAPPVVANQYQAGGYQYPGYQPQQDQLQRELEQCRQKIQQMQEENAHLRQSMGAVAGGGAGRRDSHEMDSVIEKLRAFSVSADGIIEPSGSQKPPSSPNSDRKMLYPTLGDGGESGFLMVPSMKPDTLDALLPMVSVQLDKLQRRLLDSSPNGSANSEQACIKIADFYKYRAGDIVLFYPVGVQGGAIQLSLVHLSKPKPYGMLQLECYSKFGFRPGRMADFVIGKLTREFEEAYYKDDPAVAKAVGEKDSSMRKFYRVWAEPAAIDFQRMKPSRPPPPASAPEDKEKRLSGTGLRGKQYV